MPLKGGMGVSECHRGSGSLSRVWRTWTLFLTFAYLEPDQLLRMPHSVQKVQWYKVYGEMITCHRLLVAYLSSGDYLGYKEPNHEIHALKERYGCE